MSALPPQLIASALQGTLQQRQVQHARSTADRQQADMGQAVVRAGQEHENLIENTDADSRVNADGGGAGGQGRAPGEQPQPGTPESDQPDNPQSGITSDDKGQIHLDLTA
jgi:hypothetical protein